MINRKNSLSGACTTGRKKPVSGKSGRRSSAKLGLLILALTAAALVFTGVLVVGAAAGRTGDAANSQVKVYETITVSAGDTLWSIAETYRPEESTLQNYIRELREINDITGDRIYSGQHLLVSYYSETIH